MALDIPEQADLPLAEEVADLLHTTTRRLRHAARHDLGPTGVTPAGWRALRAIAHCDQPPRMGELAERLGIARRSATAVVDDLEDHGLVARQDDPTDRRSVAVTLTTAGRDLLHDLTDRRRQATARQLQALSPAELATLRDLLRRLGDQAAGAT